MHIAYEKKNTNRFAKNKTSKTARIRKWDTDTIAQLDDISNRKQMECLVYSELYNTA